MRYLILIIAFIFSANAELHKITEIKTGPKTKIVPEGKVTKLEMIKYNVHYNKDMEKYSIFNHDKKAYLKLMQHYSITKYTLGKIFGTVDTTMSTYLTELGYDYVFHRPEAAENFYILLKENIKDIDLFKRLKIADYYIRTGRPEEIKEIVPKTKCLSNFHIREECLYYVGVAEYLLTGNNKNLSLKLAKDKIKKAQYIYKGSGL